MGQGMYGLGDVCWNLEGSCDYMRLDHDGGSDGMIENCCSDESHDCNGCYNLSIFISYLSSTLHLHYTEISLKNIGPTLYTPADTLYHKVLSNLQLDLVLLRVLMFT
jgi:hypothetical protein